MLFNRLFYNFKLLIKVFYKFSSKKLKWLITKKWTVFKLSYVHKFSNNLRAWAQS